MKKIFHSLPAILLVPFFLSACIGPRAISVSNAQNNADYTVSYLFEHDGCRVYRFYDAWSGSYVYFTTQGDVTSIPNDSTRQQTITYSQRMDSTFIKNTER